MRARHRRPTIRRPAPPAAAALDLAAGDFLTFASEGHEDGRRMRWAAAVAALAHAALFLVTFPEIARVVAEPEPPTVFVVRPIPFRQQPPPPPEPTLPASVRVPIPDPTPHLPEPIRPIEILPAPPALREPILAGIPEAPPPIPDPAPLRVGGDVTAPVRLFAPPPTYTEMARRAREEGIVVVEAVIDRTGAVTDARIVKGLRFGLDESALAAVERWRFEPATLNGQPVAVLYNLTIRFTLR